MTRRALDLEIPDPAASAAHRAGLEAHSGVMVPVPEGSRLELFTEVEVRVTHRGHPRASGRGRVIQLSPDGSAAVLFEEPEKARLLDLELTAPRRAGRHRSGSATTSSARRRRSGLPGRAPPRPAAGCSGTRTRPSILFRSRTQALTAHEVAG